MGQSARQLVDRDEVVSAAPCWLALSIAMAMVLLVPIAVVGVGRAAGDEGPSLSDLVFVTDDYAPRDPGCDAISLVDIRDGKAVARGEHRASPGQLSMTSGGKLAVSVSGNNWCGLYLLRSVGAAPSEWVSTLIDASEGIYCSGVVRGGAPAISPDDRVLLLPVADAVEKHLVEDVLRGSLSPVQGTYGAQGLMPADIVFAEDGRTAYVVGSDSFVHVIDVATMSRIGEPIAYLPSAPIGTWRVLRTYAALSPEGRYLVISTGSYQSGRVNVIDLVTRRSAALKPPQISETWGVAFNRAGHGYGLLAIHGRTRVGVYRFDGLGELSTVAVAPVLPARGLGDIGGYDPADFRTGALAWSGSGDAVVVAIGGVAGGPEWRVLDLALGETPRLTRRLDFDSCTWHDVGPPRTGVHGDSVQPLDVVSVNDRLPGLTPTPTASPCPTITPEPVIATPTATPTLAPTNTPTVTPSATPTPTVTPRPGPIYLPLSLREQCTPGQQRVEVALVIDASSSMEDPTSTGRRKLDAALDAVTQFLGNLALPSDQAAIIVFNSDAWLRQELTGDRGLLASALQGIQTAKQTRLDRGVGVGHEELVSSRRRPGNQAVMIVLTDGLANPVPASVAVEEAAAAKADQITIFTIGLGNELDESALQAMASRPDYYYWAPDAEDLAAIYRRIAVAIPCPPERFWGRR